jgi:hypothetical protein
MRKSLRVALAFAAPIAVVACAGQANPELQIINDAQTTVKALQNTVSALQATNPPVLNATQAAQVSVALDDASKLLAALNTSATATANAAVLAKVEADVQAVLAVLVAIPLPAPYGLVVQAANVVLPIISAYVNTYVSGPVVASAAPSAMTPDMARVVLAGAAR